MAIKLLFERKVKDMKTQDYNNLAALLIEYGTELSNRDARATKKRDFETLKRINDIKVCITKLLEALDEE